MNQDMEQIGEKIRKLINRYPLRESAIIPSLYLVQQNKRMIELDDIRYIARILAVPEEKVYETFSFYTMFHKQKVGKYHIQVCTNISCYLNGSHSLLTYVKKKLGIEEYETTNDGLFSLTAVECLGSCGTAPVMQINETYYEKMNEEKVDQIIEQLRKLR